MQFKQFEIDGLFGGKSHHIDFPTAQEDRVDPLVLILHGRNGVGKTTILRMLDSLLRLDFNLFRHVPFDHCALRFDSNESLTVKPLRNRRLIHLEVEFNGKKALLSPHKSGALNEEQIPRVEEFRKEFLEKTESINYEFINTERLELQRLEDENDPELRAAAHLPPRRTRTAPNPKAKFLEQPQSLATRVKRFISQAQVDYRSFFATTEPELFPKIIERLTSPRLPVYDVNSLQERFEKVHSSDKLNARFGLEPDRWDRGQIMAILNTFREKEQRNQNALTVLDAYAETLESRSAQRALVAERLRKFEHLMSSFFGDKTISIHPRDGFVIESDFHELLQERDLSSGEFHLLLLMVAALVTRRRGTVIAIDEPEMSMHLAWQRRLVPALVECASRANPLFIFATHSPDVAATYSQVLVELV